MDLRKGCLMFVSCFALAAGVGCAQPTPPPHPVTAKVDSGLVFHAKASVATQQKLGITRWHSIVEKSTGAIVTDGQDSKGRVKFITSTRFNKKDGHLHIEAFAPIKGHLIIDTKTNGIVSNTLPGTGQWADMAAAVRSDWNNVNKTVAYGFWTNAAMVGGLVVAGIGLVAAAPAIAAAAGAIGLITTAAEVGAGVALAAEALAPAVIPLVTAAVGAATAVASKIAADETDKDVAKLNERVDALEKANAESKGEDAKKDPAADPNADPAKDPAADPNATPSQDPNTTPAQDPGSTPAQDPGSTPAQDPSSTPAQDPTPSEPAQGQELPSSNAGGNLDTQSPPTDTSGSTPTDTGSDTTGGGGGGSDTTGGGGGGDTTGGGGGGGPTGDDTGGGGGGDVGGGGGGGDVGGGGGGDVGGGGGEAFAVGRCRQVAVSKITKVRACTHY